MNLIYACVWHQQSCNLLKLLITSISVKGNINKDTTDILVITSPSFQPLIKDDLKGFNLPIDYFFDTGCSRLNIFKYNNIHKYHTLLYLDTDILISSDINVLLNLEISSDKIYALNEGHIDGPACKSGILLFRNSDCIKLLFDAIQTRITDCINKEHPIQHCLDNTVLSDFVENNPSDITSKKIVYHFPGSYDYKLSKMMGVWGKMNTIIAVSPSNVYDTKKMKYLLDSAKNKNFKVEIIGLNKDFIFLSKILWLKEYLENLPTISNPIICFTDAYDVCYVDSLETVKDKFLSFGSKIVWSVEKWYSHQLNMDKQFYDNLDKSPYRYINTGTFIGYKDSLLGLLINIEMSIKDISFLQELNQEGWNLDSGAVDQTIISHHLVQNWSKYNIKLDYDCDIFYIPCGDWDDIDKHITSDITNKVTGKKPSIIHVPWKSKYEHILIRLFNMSNSLKTILDNKKYTWGEYIITFLEYGLMDAFGKGTYTQLDKYTFQANFGDKVHSLVFNNDYTEFTSTRLGDGEIIKGNLC